MTWDCFKTFTIRVGWILLASVLSNAQAEALNKPKIPRIDSVVMHPEQPQERDPAVIWYDDFDGPEKQDTLSGHTITLV